MREAIALVVVLLSGATPPRWPSAVFRQFPDRKENGSASRLMATVERFGDDLGAVRRVVPPAFLEKHANTIRSLRAQIISNEPPVWALDVNDILDPPHPPLLIHLRLFRILGADARAQKNAAAAWADLHAIWILSRSLWQRPEPMSLAVALGGSRVIAAVAPKIGTPLPEWWSEFKSFDVRAPLRHSIEYEAFAVRVRAERYPLGEPEGSRLEDTVRRIAAPIARPIRIAQASIEVGRLERVADAVAHAELCRPLVVSDAPEWAAFARRFTDDRCAFTK